MWGSGSGVGDHPTLEHPSPKPGSQQLDHLPVNYPALDLADEGLVVDFGEAGFDVGIEHPHRPLIDRHADGFEGLVGGTLRAEPEAGRQEVGLEDWFEDDLGCRHHHPVTNGGDRQGSRRLTRRVPCFGDVHPPQRLGPVRLGLQLGGECIEERSHCGDSPGFDVGDGDAVDAGGALIGRHVDPCPPHHVTAGELVVKGVEPTLRMLLGAAVEHSLEGSNGVQAVGLPDGPSRYFGTHQRPSLPRRAPVKQGPFARAGLCCPGRRHYYGPLRLPLDRLSFPGVTGYRQARSRPHRTGPRRVSPVPTTQPSDRSTPPTPEGPSAPAPSS